VLEIEVPIFNNSKKEKKIKSGKMNLNMMKKFERSTKYL
jgi:hypothetical protein